MKRQLLFQLFVVLFITLFCALGTWQLYRLQWKLELISEITFGLDSQPVEYSSSIKKNYQRINAKGKFDFDKQIYLYSLNDSGKPGYDVVTPFRTDKNQNVLINRGWIKKELKDSASINFKAKTDSEIIGLLREIYKQPAFKNLWNTEIIPGENVKTDDEILRAAQEKGGTVYHYSGSCRMGSDKNSVVDDKLKVRGIDGLRVIDASIMPEITSANINAPTIMIGEKGAEMILSQKSYTS